MNPQSAQTEFEPVIWARLLKAQGREISPEAAQFVLSIGFAESDHERMQYLADRSEEGTLTPQEQAEFDGYLHVGNLLAAMQSRARTSLGIKPVETPGA